MTEIVTAYNTDAKRVTIEDLGEFSEGVPEWRIRWKASDHWVDVEVFETTACEVKVGGEHGPPEFAKKDAACGADSTQDIDEAEPYLTGFIKWDGCSEIDFGCPHWCGPTYWQKHIKLMEHIWRTAFEVMGKPLDHQWQCPLDREPPPKRTTE